MSSPAPKVEEYKKEAWAHSDFDPSKLPELQSDALLMWHIAKKGFQAGAILSIPCSLALAYYKKEPLVSLEKMLPRLGKGGLWGTSIVSALGLLKFRQFESRDEVDDRVFRLHYNEGQNRTDLASGIGAGVGAVLAAVTGTRPRMAVVGGASLGCAAGVLLHLATFKPSEGPRSLYPKMAVEEAKSLIK